jgi:hypothetical protein
MNSPGPGRTSAAPGSGREPEAGWGQADANLYGPCWLRFQPGAGELHVVARSGGTYAWWLKQGVSAVSGPHGEGFASARTAMSSGDHYVAAMPAPLLAPLTAGEAAELDARLEQAMSRHYHPIPLRDRLYFELRDLRSDVFNHRDLLAMQAARETAAAVGVEHAPGQPRLSDAAAVARVSSPGPPGVTGLPPQAPAASPSRAGAASRRRLHP